MTFEFAQFLLYAQRLAARTDCDEAERRSAVSRAYYAAYHATRKRLLIAAASTVHTAEGSHEKVWNLAKVSPDESIKLAGKAGERLKERRVEADYRPHVECTAVKVRDAIRIAETIVRHLAASTTAP